MQKKLFLLDAMALIYRAYFALNKNPRINSKGLNTSAILGFANTLLEVLQKEHPTHIAVAFDSMAPTMRHEEFHEYKAHRESMPEDLSISIPYIKKLIEAFNIPLLEVEGYEADDIIGTLAKKAEKAGFFTYMMTPDKDFGQLISENIFMYKPAKFGEKAEVLGVAEICKKYDIKNPEQLVDILGLWGDVSDNIPGIPGIGQVTAQKLISEYGSLENLLTNTDKLKGKLKENIENYAQQGILSKELAKIIVDVPIELNEEKFIYKEPDKEALKQLFEELEFRNFAERVFRYLNNTDKQSAVKETPHADLFGKPAEEEPDKDTTGDKRNINTTKHTYHLIDTPEKRKELIAKLKQQKSFCFDTETTGIDPNSSELVAVSFAYKPGEAFIIILPDNYNQAHQIVSEFKEVFEDTHIEKIGQNIKFDTSILKWYDIDVKGKMFDTMLAHYLIQPDMRHNMDFLAQTYLDYSPIPIEALIGKKGKNQLNIRTVPAELLKEYSCEDADITLQLKNMFEPMLAESNTRKLFDEIEMPLVPVLASMEAEGINIDVNTLNEYSVQLQKEVAELEKEIFGMVGVEFNIASPKQLGDVLFDQLKIIEKPKLTKTKQYSTGEEILAKLVNKHPVIQKILDYRSLVKLKSTYVDTLPEMLNPRTRRIHTSFNQAVAATGRLSSNNPNLQNIPIRTERGREIRKAFVPRNHNYLLLSADYSQIELRIMAEVSKDSGMLEAFKQGLDIHTATAAKIYGINTKDVTKEMRRNAKTVNFGIIYGISAFGLSERLSIPKKEAADIIEQYFIKYPAVKQYMDGTIAFAKAHGYVETIMGRRRYIRDINSSNGVVRGHAERFAINAPIQGSAADMIKVAMIRIYDVLCREQLKTRMILQVHDELVFDVHKDEVDRVKTLVADNLKNAIKLNIPIEIDMNVGNNWLEAH